MQNVLPYYEQNSRFYVKQANHRRCHRWNCAYKSADLVRRLRERGAEVRVVMTANAKQFITPLTLQAVSGIQYTMIYLI